MAIYFDLFLRRVSIKMVAYVSLGPFLSNFTRVLIRRSIKRVFVQRFCHSTRGRELQDHLVQQKLKLYWRNAKRKKGYKSPEINAM